MRNSKDFSIEYIEYCCGISWFIRKGAFVCTQEPKAPVYPPRPHTGRTADLPQGRDNAQDTPFTLGHWRPPGAERVQRPPQGDWEPKLRELGLGSRQCFLYGPITVSTTQPGDLAALRQLWPLTGSRGVHVREHKFHVFINIVSWSSVCIYLIFFFFFFFLIFLNF